MIYICWRAPEFLVFYPYIQFPACDRFARVARAGLVDNPKTEICVVFHHNAQFMSDSEKRRWAPSLLFFRITRLPVTLLVGLTPLSGVRSSPRILGG